MKKLYGILIVAAIVLITGCTKSRGRKLQGRNLFWLCQMIIKQLQLFMLMTKV